MRLCFSAFNLKLRPCLFFPVFPIKAQHATFVLYLIVLYILDSVALVLLLRFASATFLEYAEFILCSSLLWPARLRFASVTVTEP